MLLSNHKYLVVKFELSSEFSDYLLSINSFLYKIINTYKDSKLLNEERFDNLVIPSSVNKLVYYEEEDSKEFISYIEKFTFEELIKQLTINREVILTFDNLIIYNEIKKSNLRDEDQENSNVRKVDETTFKKLAYHLKNDFLLKNKILEFWQCKTDLLTYYILNKYVNEKSDIERILISSNRNYIDFLPLKKEFFIDDKLMYDENHVSIPSGIVDRFVERTGIELDEDNLQVDYVNYDTDEIGIIINDEIYLFDYYMNKSILKASQNLLYKYFKSSIKVDFEKDANNIIDFTPFRSKNKDIKLTEVLSKLENNLFLRVKYEELDPEIQDFFITSYLVQNKELEDLHFIVSRERADENYLLGIFDNKGERIKGLKCWIDKNSKEIKSFENYEHVKDASKMVCHLSPEYAFYFKEKFFEDYLEDMLTEIKNEVTDFDLDFISNNKFYFSSGYLTGSPLDEKFYNQKVEQEFDFIVSIVRGGVEKNIVLEAKTKLTKFIADEQREKVQKYIKHDTLNMFDEYVLLGFNSDDTMKSLKYFQRKYPIPSISDPVDNAFKYPLPETEDKILYCISSTNYDNLKKYLINLFKTI